MIQQILLELMLSLFAMRCAVLLQMETVQAVCTCPGHLLSWHFFGNPWGKGALAALCSTFGFCFFNGVGIAGCFLFRGSRFGLPGYSEPHPA